MEALVDELVVYVLSILELKDVLQFGLTCTHFHALSRDDLLWKGLCQKYYVTHREPGHASSLLNSFAHPLVPPARAWKEILQQEAMIRSWAGVYKPLVPEEVIEGDAGPLKAVSTSTTIRLELSTRLPLGEGNFSLHRHKEACFFSEDNDQRGVCYFLQSLNEDRVGWQLVLHVDFAEHYYDGNDCYYDQIPCDHVTEAKMSIVKAPPAEKKEMKRRRLLIQPRRKLKKSDGDSSEPSEETLFLKAIHYPGSGEVQEQTFVRQSKTKHGTKNKYHNNWKWEHERETCHAYHCQDRVAELHNANNEDIERLKNTDDGEMMYFK